MLSARSVLRLSLALFCLSIAGSTAYAQITNVTDDTSAPIPGVGHDYIRLFNETVNPSNGSVSLNIQVPTPKGRGLTLPFAFTYNSNGMNHLLYIGNFQTQWRSNTSFLAQGGWTYSMPRLSYAQQSSSSPQGTCTWGADYVFSDPSGGPHALALEVAGSSFFSGGGGLVQCGVNVLSGGDVQYRATTQAGCSNGCGFAPSPVTVSDSDGTVYYFSAGAFSDGTGLNTFSNLPFNIEDRNGNKITITQSINKSFSFVDSVGRTAISASGLGPSGTTNTVNVSGLSQPYQVTWETVSANYAVPSTHIGTDTQCGGIPAVNNTQVVVQSITLPNGQKYQFSYDPTYGLLSEILYPTGGWVKYTWKPSDQNSELAVYPDSTGNQSGCIYQYAPPVVATRTVSFNGSSPAVTEVFSYATNWASGGAGWTTKTTNVSTTDNLLTKTLKTVYTYGYFLAPTQPGDNIVFAAQLPVENQIQYYDWGGSTPIRTVNKSWLDIYRLQSQQTTLDNGQSSKVTYPTYSAGVGPNNSGSQATEIDEYDFGQSTPSRKTTFGYQSFSNSPGIITDRPCQKIVYDAGGNRVAETDYLHDGATTVCGTPGTPSVSSVSNLVANTHDETLFGSGATTSRGNVTTVTRKCLQNCTDATTTYSYDETGQILARKAPCGNATCSDLIGTNHTTTYSYADSFDSNPSASTNAYLTKITDPLGHSSSFKYAYTDGQLISSTDQNSNTTSYAYNDSLRRLTETDYPDGGQTTISYNDSPYNTSTPSPSVTTTKKITSSTNLIALTAFDGMGHTVRTVLTSDPDCASGDRTDTSYDGLGRVYNVSNPYCTTSDPTYGLTTYAYDALGRITQVTNPDQSTALTSYVGSATQIQDEGNGTQRVTRISQTDGFGRLTSVCEVAPGPFVGPGGSSSSSLIGSSGTPSSCGLFIGGTGFLTTYQYDVLDNLLQVNQSGIAPRTFTYDSMSRLVCASNPENSSASCPVNPSGSYIAGTTGYTYDANGNVATRTAPAPNQSGSSTVATTYQYDQLDRITQKSYSDGVTPTAGFVYDTSSAPGGSYPGNQIGRLTYTAAGCTNTVYEYDPMGRVTYELQVTPLTCESSPWRPYQIHYTYDLMGNMTSHGDGYTPGSHTYTHTFNTAGRITTATSDAPDPNMTTFLSAAHYDAAGRPISDTLGDGETESFTYNKRGAMQSSSVTFNNTPLYSFNVSSFAPNGDVLAVSDSVNGNWTYSYDAFNRLAGANQNNGGAVYNYVYDRFGNRWQQNGPHPMILTFTGNNPSNPANNNRADGFSFDAAGNLLNDGAHSYTYDAENRLINVDSGTATYIYNAEGNRVRRTGIPNDLCDKTGKRDYVYDLSGRWISEVNDNATQCKYEIYVGNRHVVRYGGQVNFSHTDWLGTERERAADGGQLSIDACTSLPFGDALTCTMNFSGYSSTLHFTGKERDYESGLDYFGARHYASSMGRFISPDEPLMSQEKGNPQSWNLYSYVLNNPLNAVDPDGHDCVYLNNAGNGVESIDHSSNSGECGTNGGFWANGTVERASWVQILPEHDAVHIFSHYRDVVGETWAGNGYSNGDANANLIPSIAAKNDMYLDAYVLAVGLTPQIGGTAPEEEDEARVLARYPVGRRDNNMKVGPGVKGGPPTNSPATIGGRQYSGHALDRMQGRGLTPTVVEEVIGFGTPSAGTESGTTAHTAQGITVITNQTGKVVTVMYSRD